MNFQVGDKVIHRSYGLGEILQLDVKVISGAKTLCYVVKIRDLTLWVPVNQNGNSSLRRPVSEKEFKHLFDILSGPGESLPDERFERKNFLSEKLKEGKIESTCRIVRDLSVFSHVKKLNESDASMLRQAREFLLEEWQVVLSVTLSQAERELEHLLGKRLLFPLAG